MLKIRSIPEDRIKTLRMCKSINTYANFERAHITEMMIQEMGLEIARKLFQFNKVLVIEDETMFSYVAQIDVIVPKGQPDA